MEPVSKRSKLAVNEGTAVVAVPTTSICFQSHNTTTVFPTTPVSPELRQFAFQILPQSRSELFPASCRLEMTLQLTKSDNGAVPTGSQVGCIQAIAACGWESCIVRLGGVTYQPEFAYSAHATYLRLLAGHSEREKNSILQNIGWRSDTIGRFDSINVEVSISLFC